MVQFSTGGSIIRVTCVDGPGKVRGANLLGEAGRMVASGFFSSIPTILKNC